jgi:hypothetical protein
VKRPKDLYRSVRMVVLYVEKLRDGGRNDSTMWHGAIKQARQRLGRRLAERR